MKHRIKGKRLGRSGAHRKAMFANMMVSLINYECIKTTLPKAKELRPMVEKIITKSRNDCLANRRIISSILKDKNVVAKLFDAISKRYNNRNGGYLRIVKCGYRAGDSSAMAIVELVDRDAVLVQK